MKRWLQLSIIVEPVLVDPLSDFLVGVLEAGVEVNVDQQTRLQCVNCYVSKENPTDDELETIVNQIKDHVEMLEDIFSSDESKLSWEILEDQDWGQKWKEHFSPIKITPGLTIAPSWEKYDVSSEEKVLVMDPGMAFGTGHHATTALSLQLLEEIIKACDGDIRVLDVGTGTGILGMAAILYGATEAFGIDNDPVAVSVAEENIARNNLSSKMKVSQRPLSDIGEEFDVVLANIVHDVLITMATDLRRLTTIGGHLILSGVIRGEQVASIHSTFEENGFQPVDLKEEGEWAALLLIRKN